MKVRFSDRTRLDQGITYKPRFDRMQEYLANFSVSLINQLTSNFILKLNLESKYDSHLICGFYQMRLTIKQSSYIPETYLVSLETYSALIIKHYSREVRL